MVPRLTQQWVEMCDKHLGVEAFVVGPGARTGMRIAMKNPAEVGADRIVNAVAAFEKYGGPCIVADYGTATTFDVISAEGDYLGGAIAPGIEVSLEALTTRAAKLIKVELVEPEHAIGKSTTEALQSGAVYGFAGEIEGIVHAIWDELGERAPGDRHRRSRRADRPAHRRDRRGRPVPHAARHRDRDAPPAAGLTEAAAAMPSPAPDAGRSVPRRPARRDPLREPLRIGARARPAPVHGADGRHHHAAPSGAACAAGAPVSCSPR